MSMTDVEREELRKLAKFVVDVVVSPGFARYQRWKERQEQEVEQTEEMQKRWQRAKELRP